MKMKKWVHMLPAALMIAGIVGFAGCKKAGRESASDDKVIKVGEYASLTGLQAAFGQSSHKGTLLAVEDLNAKGGVLGKKIDLITEDDQSKISEAGTAAQKLVSRDKVVALLGEVASGCSLVAADICQQYHVPMISPSSTNPKVTEKGDYIFRVCFTDPFQGRLRADFAKKNLKVNRIAVLTDVASAYSVGLADYFKKPFVANGGTIVAEQKYSSGDKDFKAQLTAIKAANPEAIFVPGYYTEAALITQQARQLGITVPLFGGDGWEAPELLQIGGAAMEGTYYSTHYSSENESPVVQEFVKKYKARWGGETPDAMAALGYDSAMVLADAIKHAGTTEEPKLRDAIAATKDYQGITGTTTLDADRNATKPAVIITVKDGKFKYVETINP